MDRVEAAASMDWMVDRLVRLLVSANFTKTQTDEEWQRYTAMINHAIDTTVPSLAGSGMKNG